MRDKLVRGSPSSRVTAVIGKPRRYPPVDFAVPITAINRSPDHPIGPPRGGHSSPFVAWGISPFFGRDRWGLPAFSIRRYPCGTARGPRQARLWLVGLAALLCCAPSVFPSLPPHHGHSYLHPHPH